MEEQVNDLKEKIFRTKARCCCCRVGARGGTVTQGAKAVLVHRNEMGSSFYLESVAYALDGAPVYTKVDVDGDLDKKEESEDLQRPHRARPAPDSGQAPVPRPRLRHLQLLEGYKFKVQSSYTFDAEPGRSPR
jgi:hypothetical protein